MFIHSLKSGNTMNRQHIILFGGALLGALCLPALAQPAPTSAALVASAPGKALLARTVKVTGTIEAVDGASRQITVKGPKGNLAVLAVGAEVRNFDQLKVGDRVVAQYVEALSLTLKKDGKELRSSSTAKDGARAPAGDKPAGAVARQIEVTADVIAVDAKTQVVMLRGPKQTVELKVPDRQQFKAIKVGDQIQAVYTEAVALSVEPAAPAKK
jgi:Cu/Ag efflux protein CusF